MEGAAEVVAKGVAAKVVVARARAAADWSIACALKALGSAAAVIVVIPLTAGVPRARCTA
jgi:hypothetical protein